MINIKGKRRVPKKRLTAKERQAKRRRLKIYKLNKLLILFIICLVGLFLRIAYLQVVYGDVYRREVTRQQVVHRGVDTTINPNRGDIVDRNGQQLAFSTTVYSVVLDVRRLFNSDDTVTERVVRVLNDVLDISEERLWGYLSPNPDNPSRPVRDTYYLVLERQVPPIIAHELASYRLAHVFLEEDTLRHYPGGAIAGPLIGFLRGDNSHWGLERAYNLHLGGVPGRNVRMFNESGLAQTSLIRPRQGYTVVTTLDSNLQEMAVRVAMEFGELHNTVHASIIIMNPNTAEILAMAEHPTFDAADPFNINLVNGSVMRSLLNNTPEEDRMDLFFNLWTNYNISSSFEPGSVAKAMSGAAALNEGLTYHNERFYCGGSLTIAGETINCWNEFGHGTLSLSDAMAVSCNVVFMQLGGRLGRARMYNYLNDFGVGSLTGIDLHGEADVRALTYRYNQLNPVELATSAMGQGFNMTPIQMMTSFAAVINGGNVMQPFMVSRVMDQAENRIVMENEPVLIRNVISQQVSDFWREEMVQVLENPNGTGRDAFIGGFSIGGKTGTGQQGARDGEVVQSFLAYIPVDNPRYLVMVSLNRPSQGQATVPIQPMLKTVMQYIITARNISNHGGVDTVSDEIAFIENYYGLTIVEASERLRAKGLALELYGNGGTVIGQMPAPWSSVAVGSTVVLYLSESNDENGYLNPVVPNLQNLSLEQAQDVLNLLELNYYIIDNSNGIDQIADNRNSLVIGQMPSAGIRVPIGTEIVLILNDPPQVQVDTQ